MPTRQIGAEMVGWEGHDNTWSIWCDDFDWDNVVAGRAYGKPLTDMFATELPSTLQLGRDKRLVVDISGMPVGEDFRLWLEFDMNDNTMVRVPDAYDLLTIR
jgi:hypothetical protein